jgi:hypothetical protein
MIRWYLQRSLVMSPAEIGHRVIERFRRFRSRHHRQGWAAFDLGDGPLAGIEPFRSMGVAAWTPQIVRTVGATADQVQISFMGQKWPAGEQFWQSPGLWFRDPASGKQWPGS